MNKIQLVYHGVVNSKKNSKRIVRNWRTGAPMVMASAAAQRNARDMIVQFINQLSKTVDLRPPLRIDMIITQKDRVRRDLDNQATSILDALVAAKAIPDDSVKVIQEINVSLGGYDKYDPKALITISEM